LKKTFLCVFFIIALLFFVFMIIFDSSSFPAPKLDLAMNRTREIRHLFRDYVSPQLVESEGGDCSSSPKETARFVKAWVNFHVLSLEGLEFLSELEYADLKDNLVKETKGNRVGKYCDFKKDDVNSFLVCRERKCTVCWNKEVLQKDEEFSESCAYLRSQSWKIRRFLLGGRQGWGRR
jgi:hypothetical protein